MKEENRLRIERLAARYADRRAATRAPDEAEFLAAFDEVRRRVIRPAMEEVAEALRRAGHAPRVALDEGPDAPSIELSLGLRGGPGSRNVVGFSVIRWSKPALQILSYLEVSPPQFDLDRFTRAADVLPERVEQILVDAVEHIVVCNAP